MPMLVVHGHPLSSYVQKALTALYENATPFRLETVNLGDPASRERLLALWPMGKMPVLSDEARHETVPEATIIIEYLEAYYPGPAPLVPKDAEQAWRCRLADRFYDLHIQNHMQKVVGDRLRPADKRDPHGVAQARDLLATAYGIVERTMANRTWALGETFSMADCAAGPALFYADRAAVPLGTSHPNAGAYLKRLMARPGYARALKEAEPFFHMIPT
jgi:glutathione S-transferase